MGDLQHAVVVDPLDLSSDRRWQGFPAVFDDAERREGVDLDRVNLDSVSIDATLAVRRARSAVRDEQ